MKPPIFLSYRREDAGSDATALYFALREKLGTDKVFMDVSSIERGARWPREIAHGLANAGAMLVIIGPKWLTRRRRLDSKKDWVRREITIALRLKIPIIPILVRGAKMPPRATLPKQIADLAIRQALEVRHDHWEQDIQPLLSLFGKGIEPVDNSVKRAEQSASAAESQPLSEKHSVASVGGHARSPLTPIIQFLAVAVFIALQFFSYSNECTPSFTEDEPRKTGFVGVLNQATTMASNGAYHLAHIGSSPLDRTSPAWPIMPVLATVAFVVLVTAKAELILSPVFAVALVAVCLLALVHGLSPLERLGLVVSATGLAWVLRGKLQWLRKGLGADPRTYVALAGFSLLIAVMSSSREDGAEDYKRQHCKAGPQSLPPPSRQ